MKTMNKFRYVTQQPTDEPILINLDQICCIDERKQIICMSSGLVLKLTYNDVWQLADDLKNLYIERSTYNDN